MSKEKWEKNLEELYERTGVVSSGEMYRFIKYLLKKERIKAIDEKIEIIESCIEDIEELGGKPYYLENEILIFKNQKGQLINN